MSACPSEDGFMCPSFGNVNHKHPFYLFPKYLPKKILSPFLCSKLIQYLRCRMRLSTLFSWALHFLTSVRLLSNILSSTTHESATPGLCCCSIISQIGTNRLAIASVWVLHSLKQMSYVSGWQRKEQIQSLFSRFFFLG